MEPGFFGPTIYDAVRTGFEFRRWYVGKLRRPWAGGREAVEVLTEERRYYALLFSHEFASSFWKSGVRITFMVPQQSFQRVRPDGTVSVVHRKSYTRRSAREDSWKYHLRELAVAEDPLRYMKRYLRVEEDVSPEIEATPAPDLLDQQEDEW
jgi:hypothetical protein